MIRIRRVGRIASLVVALTLSLVAAASAPAQMPGLVLTAQERAAITSYPLTMDKMRRVYAAAKQYQHLLDSDPALQRSAESMAQQSFTAQIATIEGNPKLAGVIRGTGLSVREFAVAGRAVGGAQAIVRMQESGTAVPPQVATRMAATFPASAEQVAFVKAHRAELDRLVADVAAAAPKP